MKNIQSSLTQNSQWLLFLLDALLIGIVLRFLFVGYDGLFLLEFGDESEKYVAARMLLEGKRLYTEIFSHHGPLLYMFTHVYAGLIDSSQFNWARAIQVILASASALSIYLSPVLTSRAVRHWAVAIYIGMLSSVWLVQSLNMLLYHSVAGFLFVIVLSQMVLPALLGCRVSFFQLALSVFCMAMACFSAYVYLPSAALFFLVYLVSYFQSRSDNTRTSNSWFAIVSGVAIALVVVVTWLYLYGDIKGYLVYHLYFNQKIYSSFLWWLSPTSVVHNLTISLTPSDYVKIAINGLLLCSSSMLLAPVFFEKKPKARFILSLLILLAGMFYLNPRGDGSFRNGALLVATLAFFAITAAMTIDYYYRKNLLAPVVFLLIFTGSLIVALEIIARSAKSSPHEMDREVYSTSYVKLATDWSDRYKFIRLVVSDNEKMLVLPFGYGEYIFSDRMPATGQASYLPWAAAYKRNPIDGYKMDICNDLRANLPPLIIYDSWLIWEKYQLPEYEPCIMEIFFEHYTSWNKHPELYIRNDRFTELRVDQM
jgi:hypothetical protein